MAQFLGRSDWVLSPLCHHPPIHDLQCVVVVKCKTLPLTKASTSQRVETSMKFNVVGSDDVTFPVTIEGSLTLKELIDKVHTNHQHVLTSIGQGTRSDFLLALRYKESHAIVPTEVISQVLSDGDTLIAIWASTLARVAPGKHRAALIKLAQYVAYANGAFFCTLGIVDALAINSAPQVQVADSKISVPRKQRISEAPKPSAVSSSASASAPVAAGSGSLPPLAAHDDSASESESSGSSSSSVSSESSESNRAPVVPPQLVTHAVRVSGAMSESGSSSSSVSSSVSSSSVSSSSSASTSDADDAKKPAVGNLTPNRVLPIAQAAPAPKPSAPRAVANHAATARKGGPAKAANATAAVKSTAVMPSPAAPTEKAILAQISSGVAVPSSAPKKRGARGGKNSASKAKTANTAAST